MCIHAATDDRAEAEPTAPAPSPSVPSPPVGDRMVCSTIQTNSWMESNDWELWNRSNCRKPRPDCGRTSSNRTWDVLAVSGDRQAACLVLKLSYN